MVHALIATLQQYPQPRLIIFDPLVKFHTLDENSNGDMNQFLDLLGQIGETVGAAVLLTHHTAKGKITETGDLSAQEAARGAGAIVNEARWQAALQPLGPKMIAKLDIDEEQAWRYLTLSTPKRNSTARLPDILLERGPEGILMAVGRAGPSVSRTSRISNPNEEGIPIDDE